MKHFSSVDAEMNVCLWHKEHEMSFFLEKKAKNTLLVLDKTKENQKGNKTKVRTEHKS